jgi:hypothetical protein
MKERYPVANNRTSSKITFEAKQVYKQYFYEQVSQIDVWEDKIHYGKVDRNNIAVSLLEESAIRQFNTTKILFAVDFVVDAFEDFYTEILNRTSISDRIVSLVPTKAWQGFTQDYKAFLQRKRDFFKNNVLPKHKNTIKNFEDFFKILMNFILTQIEEIPFTRSGFLLSKYCSIYTTGLVIDLSDGDKSEDLEKSKLILEDDFLFFLNTAAKYGFYVDKNVPWRLIANLSSSKMQKYMKIYGLTYEPGSATDYFENYCFPVYLDELDDLREFSESLYKEFSEMYPIGIERTRKNGQKIITKTKKQIIEKVPQDRHFWNYNYFQIRIKEKNLEIHEKHQKRILKKAEFLGRDDIEVTLKVINVIRYIYPL